jgi:hypothetical protein
MACFRLYGIRHIEGAAAAKTAAPTAKTAAAKTAAAEAGSAEEVSAEPAEVLSVRPGSRFSREPRPW